MKSFLLSILFVNFSSIIVEGWGIPTAGGVNGEKVSAPAAVDPMSMADSKVTGCPFLISDIDRGMWDVPALFNENDSRPIILFDDSNGGGDPRATLLQNSIVQRLLKSDSCRKDSRGTLRYAPLNSQVGKLLCRRMKEQSRNIALQAVAAEKSGNSFIICSPTSTYTKSNAALLVGRVQGGWRKPIRYMSLMAYAFPSKLRDRIYDSLSGLRRFKNQRRNNNLKEQDEGNDLNEVFDQRYVDDAILLNGKPTLKALTKESLEKLQRGDRVRIVWPIDGPEDPSVTVDGQYANGVCMVGGTATVATVDLPMRIVVKIDRSSLGIEPDFYEGDIMYAWVNPSEVDLLVEEGKEE